MDRPRPSRTAPSSPPSRADAEPGASRAQLRPGDGATAAPARLRWARWLLWLALALAIAVGTGSRLLDTLPVPPAHASVTPTVLYDRYGTPLAEIGPSVPHASLGLEDMAPALVDALVAVLDPSFLARDGVDATSYAGALRRAWGDTGGAAGQAQDGIMRRYLDTVHHERDDAPGEARMLLAELRLGRQLSRPEILERFANIVYLGRGAYGVHAAAAAWYGVPASDLTVTQAAYLASLVDAPVGVDAASGPADDPHRTAREGRDRVLVAMHEHGVLTSDELAAGRREPVDTGLRPTVVLGAEATDPGAFDDAAGGFVRMLVDEIGVRAAVRQAYIELVERYGIHRVVTGGLHVTTALDVPAQRTAVQAVRSLFGEAPSGAAGAVLGAEVAVVDRSGDVRVLVSALGAGAAGDVDAVSIAASVRQRPLGDLLDAAAHVLQPWIAPDLAAEVVPQAAGVSQVAAAFGVVAADGEERASRIVLEAAATVPSRAPSDREADRWPMQRTPVLDAASVAELRSGMDAFTLPSGVEALGRAGVAPETGDAWFVGSTSHYTAAVRITSTSPADPLAAAQRASELFTAVLGPLQYPQ